MTLREKALIGLKCLIHVDDVAYERECLEGGCPYMNTDCEIAVMEDALNLLENMGKEQEMRE